MCRTIAKLYENCKVQLKTGKSMCEIDYKTGVQQGDNMAPILFLYIMQAAIESLHMKLTCNKLEFCYFPNNKKLNLPIWKTCSATKAKNNKRWCFPNWWPAICGWWYLPFLNLNWNERSIANNSWPFCQIQTADACRLNKCKIENRSNVLPLISNSSQSPEDFDLNNGNNHVQFTDKFKYLGSIVTPCLTENAEINARIKRAKSQTGILRHFFSCMDIKLRAKYWVYIAGCLNILLWGQNPGIFLIRTESNFVLSITP